MPRSVKNILKELCNYDLLSAAPTERLPHNCYLIKVGHLASQEHFQKLLHMDELTGISSHSVDDEIQAEYEVLKSEEFEEILEYIKLEGKPEILENNRKAHFVYEDNFNSSLVSLVERDSSLEKLKRICQKFEERDDGNINEIMRDHEERMDLSAPYFIEKGVSPDEAKALSLAISFYTGARSEACNVGTRLIVHTSSGQKLDKYVEQEMHDSAVILYYLVKALSYIPMYWGYVTRNCELTVDELTKYVPGNLVTWIQFSSSKRGKKAITSETFNNRNTIFKIFSLTGRSIQQFSNFPEEDEVLFLPHSTFLVFNHKVFYAERKHVIYMRQVELGLCKWSVMWVDDRIFDPNWENKSHMEYAGVRALDVNVHFIPKSSTESALCFLRSPFGQRLKGLDTFRIVTDMNRLNEKKADFAGARLIKAIRQMGFTNKCLMFTSDRKKAERILQSELNSKELQSVSVVVDAVDLRNFINFERNAPREHLYKSRSSSSSSLSIDRRKSSRSNTSLGITDPIDLGRTSLDVPSRPITPKLYMHNTTNTDVEVIIRNGARVNAADSEYNCVLLMTGSFNPVQPGQLQSFIRVKKFLEREQEIRWNVLAAYISPSHDSFVLPKFGEAASISAVNRCRLCEEAIDNIGQDASSWIRVTRGESEWPRGFVNSDAVTKKFTNFLNYALVHTRRVFKHPLRVFYVCLLELFNKSIRADLMKGEDNIMFGVLYRIGVDEGQIRHSPKESNVIYIPLTKDRSKYAK